MNSNENHLIVGRAEYSLVKKEIADDGPMISYGRSLKRLDAVLGSILDKSDVKPCCSKGCWYCCDIKVDMKACEALFLAEFIKSRLSSGQQTSILEKAKQNADILRCMTEEERLTAHLQCSLLIDNCCIAYDVRPANCRIYHSIDLRTCEKTYNEPTNLYIPRADIDDYYSSGKGHYEGFCAAAEEAGYDDDDYELNIAIVEALTNGASLKRYKKKKRTFLI